jgi:Uma2 family endonuclease
MASSLEPPSTPGAAPALADEVSNGAENEWTVPPEAIPNVENLITEDGKPVDNFFVEKQQRLLTESLYASWSEGGSFVAAADVGLFAKYGDPPFVPDVMLSLEVEVGDLSIKENRSYFVWVMGKFPDVIVEIVSDKRGGEETHKMGAYARMRIPYYVIFDPEQHLGKDVLRAFGLRRRTYEPLENCWFPDVGLGLVLWEGEYEHHRRTWLRWCDGNGKVIPTGNERADQAEQRAQRLAQQLRELGKEPME